MGAVNAKDPHIRYEQTKRIIERFLSDLKKSGQTKFFLESCNVSATATAIEAVGASWCLPLPAICNKEIFSYADLLFFFLYSNNFNPPVTGDGLCENEVLKNLAYAAQNLSTAEVEYLEFEDNAVQREKAITSMMQKLESNCAIVLSYDNGNGGHFISVLDYDKDMHNFIYDNPWGNDPKNKNNGFNEKMDAYFLRDSMRPRYMIISKEL